MDAADHTDAQVALPAVSSANGDDDFPAGARTAFLGLIVAAAGTLFATMLVAIAFTAAGVDKLSDNHAFVLVLTLAQDAIFVIVAYALTADQGPVTPATFGLRPFGPSALGTMALAFGAYFGLAAIYSALVSPPCDNLPDDLGVHQSALLATLAGVFVIGVAPVAEEFFFRGFIFQALRKSWGVWLAAPASGLIFGAVHFELDKLVPLAILGTALAWVFHRTRSIYPCMLMHSLNNTLAFIVLLSGSSC
jgi:membrane protease YdiL (CAAX protease family)